MSKDLSRYIVTGDTEFVEEVADLDAAGHTWPDGRPLTEASTDAFTDAEAAEPKSVGGRPSLGSSGSSPQVAFRIPQDLREAAERVAAAEGRTVSAVARAALEEYVAQH